MIRYSVIHHQPANYSRILLPFTSHSPQLFQKFHSRNGYHNLHQHHSLKKLNEFPSDTIRNQLSKYCFHSHHYKYNQHHHYHHYCGINEKKISSSLSSSSSLCLHQKRLFSKSYELKNTKRKRRSTILPAGEAEKKNKLLESLLKYEKNTKGDGYRPDYSQLEEELKEMQFSKDKYGYYRKYVSNGMRKMFDNDFITKNPYGLKGLDQNNDANSGAFQSKVDKNSLNRSLERDADILRRPSLEELLQEAEDFLVKGVQTPSFNKKFLSQISSPIRPAEDDADFKNFSPEIMPPTSEEQVMNDINSGDVDLDDESNIDREPYHVQLEMGKKKLIPVKITQEVHSAYLEFLKELALFYPIEEDLLLKSHIKEKKKKWIQKLCNNKKFKSQNVKEKDFVVNEEMEHEFHRSISGFESRELAEFATDIFGRVWKEVIMNLDKKKTTSYSKPDVFANREYKFQYNEETKRIERFKTKKKVKKLEPLPLLLNDRKEEMKEAEERDDVMRSAIEKLSGKSLQSMDIKELRELGKKLIEMKQRGESIKKFEREKKVQKEKSKILTKEQQEDFERIKQRLQKGESSQTNNTPNISSSAFLDTPEWMKRISDFKTEEEYDSILKTVPKDDILEYCMRHSVVNESFDEIKGQHQDMTEDQIQKYLMKEFTTEDSSNVSHTKQKLIEQDEKEFTNLMTAIRSLQEELGIENVADNIKSKFNFDIMKQLPVELLTHMGSDGNEESLAKQTEEKLKRIFSDVSDGETKKLEEFQKSVETHLPSEIFSEALKKHRERSDGKKVSAEKIQEIKQKLEKSVEAFHDILENNKKN